MKYTTLKHIRLYLGLTERQFASLLGVGFHSMRSYLYGYRNMPDKLKNDLKQILESHKPDDGNIIKKPEME